ncbi:MAG: hypothetical protein E4H05_01800 [Acidimicrobiales bacterium]|nr:MAG: hypothetical protein E4H05_01800 [Acidimicrobiales bacterium]
MTPQSSARRVPAPRAFIRRSATFLVAAALVGGVPLVAQALTEEPGTEALVESITAPSITAPSITGQVLAESTPRPASRIPDLGADLEVAAPPAAEEVPPSDPALEAFILVLTDTYEWDERSPRVEALQQALGVAADGWYGQATHRAHSAALEFAGLPTDTLPVLVLPPGPPASQWAALRDCESGGDYSITNPSGKYRGAYQFDRSTWNSVAERHAPSLVGVDPAAASPADQDAMALALYSERGARPWPRCGRHLN